MVFSLRGADAIGFYGCGTRFSLLPNLTVYNQCTEPNEVSEGEGSDILEMRDVCSARNICFFENPKVRLLAGLLYCLKCSGLMLWQ